jgi:hypothetical protein
LKINLNCKNVFLASTVDRWERKTKKNLRKIFFIHDVFTSFAGAIFEQGTDEVQSAFKFAMLNHNLNVTGRRFELQAYVDLISTADAFKLSRLSEYRKAAYNTRRNAHHHRNTQL